MGTEKETKSANWFETKFSAVSLLLYHIIAQTARELKHMEGGGIRLHCLNKYFFNSIKIGGTGR